MDWRNNLKYNLPEQWVAEENGDNLFIYNPDGEGAITISAYNMINMNAPQIETVLNLFQDFVAKNGISLDTPTAISYYVDSKLITTGIGRSCDQWFIKIWCICQYYKILLATYLAEKATEEITLCDQLICSMELTL